MPMNFHSAANQRSYATRAVDSSWIAAIRTLVDPAGKAVHDIGCGGGIYSRALAELGAAHVTGVDSSAVMLAQAAQTCAGLPQVSFHRGDAQATGLPAASADFVLERALLHHVPSIAAAALEAYRLLRPGGLYLAQDRTAEDYLLPGSPGYPRGYFGERFPVLNEIERRRRPTTGGVIEALLAAGFVSVQSAQLTELRREYTTFDEFAADIRARTERSILHELSDDQLEQLVEYMRPLIGDVAPLRDASIWTLWWGSKPAH